MEDLGSPRKNHAINDIFGRITTDIRISDGHYVPLGVTPPAIPTPNVWSDYASLTNNGSDENCYSVPQPIDQGVNAMFLSDTSNGCKEVGSSHIPKPKETYVPHHISYGKQPPLNVGAESRKVIGTVVDSGGNIVSVVYSDADVVPQPYCIMTCENRESNAHPLGEFNPFHDNNLNDFDYSNAGNQLQHPQQTQAHPFRETVNHHAHLIENFVGNWVPTQSGTYSPFGCTDVRMRQVHLRKQAMAGESSVDQDCNVKKVSEVHSMRPSYSDVLTKSASLVPPAAKSSVMGNTVNDKAYSSNYSKSKVTLFKCNSSKKNNKNNAFKRQNSSGSEEHTNVNSSKLNQNSGLNKKSTANCLKHNNFEQGFDVLNFNSLSRKWVSLDDLDNKEASNLEEEILERESVMQMKPGGSGDASNKKSPGASNSRPRCEEDNSTEEMLNNHKPPYSPGGKGADGLGATSTKRPAIHINNNLGTSTWSNGKDAAVGEKNVVKGVKNCRNAPEDRKGNKNDSKSGSAGSRAGSARNSCSPGKRRSRKKECNSLLNQIYQPVKLHVMCWSQLAMQIAFWFFHLLADVLSMSGRLLVHLCGFVCAWLRVRTVSTWKKLSNTLMHFKLLERLGLQSDWWNFWQSNKKSAGASNNNAFKDGLPLGLENNIALPATGDEAMRRLLACKGKDPYSILGVTPNCTDDDIKKYYKRQAVLVHPDKNNQPGAEEAFKILVHAFELIGEPEQRSAYDRRVAETHQVEQAWTELSDLLSQLHKKMEYAANTIRCTNCGKRHRRIPVARPCYAARFCAQCRIHHNAREGDIWAESSMFGFLWHYYACMDGGVYDITEWAACQADNMKHLRANIHTVQYRIVLGKESQQPHSRPHTGRPGQKASPEASSGPDLEDFLNNLYQPGASGSSAETGRPDQRRNRRKAKRKK